MSSRGAIGAFGVAALLLVGVSCGNGSDDAETPAKTTEGTVDDQADVDLSDGKVEVSDGKGGTYELNTGGDTSLPANFPPDLEVPGTTKVLVASTTSTDGRALQQVTVQFEGTVAEVYAAYKQQLAGAGYEIQSDTSGDQGGTSFGSASASNEESTVQATFSADATGQGTASITVAAKP